MTSAEVRTHLVDALRLDLIGPERDDVLHAEEVLSTSPSQWYLGGFLVPLRGPRQSARRRGHWRAARPPGATRRRR